MDIKESFGVDKRKEVEGVWEDLGGGTMVLVARAGNPKFTRLLQKLSRPHRHAIKSDSLPEDVAMEMLIKTMSKTVLLDWDGMKEDGKEIVYSSNEAVRLLTEYPDFRDYISGLSRSMEIFRAVGDEESEGN